MTDRALDRFDTSRGSAWSQSVGEDAAAAEDHEAFGWLRGSRDKAVMLQLRKRDGNIMAIAYSWIERIEFDPTEGIRLYVGGKVIRIKGRNLAAEIRPNIRLMDGLCTHRVPWIQEARSELATSDDGLVITAIEPTG